jgi:large subunit ribosomal protein L2
VTFPSKKTKTLSPDCRATIGVVAGGGRTEKPLVKAGNMYRKRKAKNHRYPKVCGTSMNAVAHPFGGSSSGTKGRPMNARRFASPGEKVGKLRAKRTGKKR